MKRALLLIVVLAAVAVTAVVSSGMYAPGSSALAPNKPGGMDLHLWHWSASRRLAPDEERDLAAAGVSALCQWTATIDVEAGHARMSQRGGSVSGLEPAARWAVVRVEPRCTPMLDDERSLAIVHLAIQAFQRAASRGRIAGLQIDWDVPERKLAAYAGFLVRLRAGLPAGSGLSCTGLVCWLKRRDLLAVLDAVDWWVPQCYAGDPPHDPRTARSLVACGEVTRVAAACEALGHPYRIGLPLYETAAVWDRDGAPVNNALPLCAESALASGLPVTALAGDERLLLITCARETQLAARRITAGSTVLLGMPTVASLSAQVTTLRRVTGSHFRGLSLFRLQAPGDLPALSAAQVLAAVSGSTAMPDLIWRWEGRSGAWSLVIENRGLADLVAVARPRRLSIAWHGILPADVLPGGLNWSPALAGMPVSSTHADSVVVQISFLRAGTTLRLPSLPAMGLTPPPCRPADEAPPEREDP